MSQPLAPRQTDTAGGDDTANAFLKLVADPFNTAVQANAIYASLIWSFAVSGGLFIIFCFLRPRAPTIYAPRAKHADERHAPLVLDKGLFSWSRAIRDVKELDMVEKIGLDAVVFLRFLRMLRNIFLVAAVVGCGILIPVNVVGGHGTYSQWSNVATLLKFTPQYIFGNKLWAFVIVAYILQGTVCFFLWWNYRAILRLRRAYFNSQDYRASLHSRTLLLTHIPEASRNDAGITELVEQAKSTEDVPRTTVGRNVKELPELIEEHDEAVQKLEGYLAKYLKNPNKLPEKRPMCKVSKKDATATSYEQSGKVDAIDYLTARIKHLETEIREVRESVDKRNPMPYGFASYTHIEDAHAVAYAARKKGPQGATVKLAPKPNDLLWQNLTMTRAMRKTRMTWDGIWMALLTIAFIVPNILTSVFLSDFSHLGLVWPAFQKNLEANPVGWGIASGIIAPIVQTLMYMAIPTLFRRLYTHSGDDSKTTRERHVTSRLYAFFIFNNLVIFSIFGSAWKLIAAIVASSKDSSKSTFDAIKENHPFANFMTGLINVSTFWLTYQLQRNLSAATDLVQVWPLIWNNFQRRFMNPTPRQVIALTAPQPFQYADYYNNFLFIATVGFTFGTLQPIILPITAFYLTIDTIFKKYLLQYVLITKTESGGVFWRMLVNRMLFAILLGNAVIALVVGAQGVGSQSSIGDFATNGAMLYAMVPLPLLLWGFKWYCSRVFDDKISYYTTKSLAEVEGPGANGDISKESKKRDRVGVKFGHPALYKKLMTPMVHAKSQHLLKELYKGNLEQDTDYRGMGYSDVYMTEMSAAAPGKTAKNDATAPFEFVSESDLDFENFKRRAEFREQFGGDGELYGRPDDMISRPGTPSTFTTFTGAGAGYQSRSRSESPSSTRASSRTRIGGEDFEGTAYKPGYQPTPSGALRGGDSPSFRPTRLSTVGVPDAKLDEEEILSAGHPAYRGERRDSEASQSGSRLLDNAQRMGRSPPPMAQPGGGYFSDHQRNRSGGSAGRGRSGLSTPGDGMEDVDVGAGVDTGYQGYQPYRPARKPVGGAAGQHDLL